MYTDSASSSTEARNGSRQPHCSKACSPSTPRVTAIASSASSRPMVPVPITSEVFSPRRCGAECSAT